MEPLRQRSFRVRCSPEEVVRQAKRIAEETTELTHHEDREYTIILKSYPTILSDGHFFWIHPESRSSNETRVDIHCRPRVFHFWHLFATRETNMVHEKLKNALSEQLLE